MKFSRAEGVVFARWNRKCVKNGVGQGGVGAVGRRLILLEFADFEVFRVVVDGEAYQCCYAVESLSSGGAGVDMQQVVGLVVHHAEYV